MKRYGKLDYLGQLDYRGAARAARRGVRGLLGPALAALVVVPPGAVAQDANKAFDETIDVSFQDTVAVVIDKTVNITKAVEFVGTVIITGEIPISAAALVLIDNQQFNDDGFVSFFGGDTQVTNAISVGPEALQSAGGNIGLNFSTGDSILQHNAGTIASTAGPSGDGSSGAEVFSLQSTVNNVFAGGEAGASMVNEVALLGAVLESASGNIGLNVATGAFHVQSNALAMAATSGNANLSQSLAAVVQQAAFGQVVHNSTTNRITIGQAVLANATGNIGINLTAGNNNIQQNTLVVSTGQ